MWSKLKFKWIAHHTIAENLKVRKWHMAIAFHFSSQCWHFTIFINIHIYRVPTLLSATKEGFKTQSVLHKGRSFTASAETKTVVLPMAGFPPQTLEPRLQFYQGLNRCGSFPLLYASHSLFSIWTNFKRSQKIPGAPTRRWGACIWLTGPSGLHRNSPQGLNISSIGIYDQIREPEIPIILR